MRCNFHQHTQIVYVERSAECARQKTPLTQGDLLRTVELLLYTGAYE